MMKFQVKNQHLYNTRAIAYYTLWYCGVVDDFGNWDSSYELIFYKNINLHSTIKHFLFSNGEPH